MQLLEHAGSFCFQQTAVDSRYNIQHTKQYMLQTRSAVQYQSATPLRICTWAISNAISVVNTIRKALKVIISCVCCDFDVQLMTRCKLKGPKIGILGYSEAFALYPGTHQAY